MSSTDIKKIRQFGIIALCFFGTLCGLGLWRQKILPSYFFGFLASMGFGFILLPAQLKPVYSGWIKVAHAIGMAITAIALSLAYFCVITPAAILLRLAGRQLIVTKPDKKITSYWVPRTEPAQPKERFLKRF